MSNYHGEIMNITAGRNAVIEDNLIAAGVTTIVTAYKCGQRDARHAAAQIAAQADARITELEASAARSEATRAEMAASLSDAMQWLAGNAESHTSESYRNDRDAAIADGANEEIEKWKMLYYYQRDALKYWDEKTRRVLAEIREYPVMAEAINGLCGKKREQEAKLRAYQETAEHYCAVDTPISADGIRAHIATIEAQLAAANHRVAELEAERTVAPLASGSERRG